MADKSLFERMTERSKNLVTTATNDVTKPSPSKYVTVGDIRKLISSLSDDTPVLYEIDDEVVMTYQLGQIDIKQARTDELETMSFDISYFDNSPPGSKPILMICAHEGKLRDSVIEQTGPGMFVSRHMKTVTPSV